MAGQALSAGIPLAQQANQANQAQLTNMLNAVMPGYQGMFNQMGANVSSELAGNVPADVQNQIQRSSAYQALTSGIGAGGAGTGMMGKTITARDLGLTSLDLMGKGEAGLGSMFGMARNYMMPQLASAQSMIPLSTMVGEKQWQDQAMFEANLAGYTAAAQQAGAQVSWPNMMGQQIAGIGGTAGGFLSSLGQQNPQTGQSGYDLISQLFGGSGVSGLSGQGFGSTGGIGYSGTGDIFNTSSLQFA